MSESTEVSAGQEAAIAPKPVTPLGGIHTNSFPRLLDQLGASLAVTTYQAGRLALLRPEPGPSGPVLNTNFRGFKSPMGLAWERGRLALGTANEVWEFHDMPSVGPKLDTPDSPAHHDAAFLPRNIHFTGGILIHEMAWVPAPIGDSSASRLSELWFVNTRFSCLSTRSPMYSFVSHWKPPFITALAPEDRCHLNGMGLRDGYLRYVTALGVSDKPMGWRENKRSGGILMDVASNEIIATGLSMPHSPRWHNGRLWVLESGNGGLGVVDERTGRYEEVCRLPGFTRGLDFAGAYAFVGLSQVREKAVFSGIAIAETPAEERCCGVWIVDTRTGKIAGYTKFTDQVQEIFAVKVLWNMRWPDILHENPEQIAVSFELPREALEQVPANLRSPTIPR